MVRVRNGVSWHRMKWKLSLSKSKALGTWVIDANGERVQERSSQSIFSPMVSACVLMPAFWGSIGLLKSASSDVAFCDRETAFLSRDPRASKS
jgi:hypothetical protein